MRVRDLDSVPFDLNVLAAVDSPEGLAAQLRGLRALGTNPPTLESLAKKVGMTKTTLSNWFRGVTAPSSHARKDSRSNAEVAYDNVVKELAQRAGFDRAHQEDVCRAFRAAVERVADRRAQRRRLFAPGVERPDARRAPTAVPVDAEARDESDERMHRSDSGPDDVEFAAASGSKRTKTRRWAIGMAAALAAGTAAVVLATQLIHHWEGSVPGAQPTTPPTAGEVSSVTTAAPSEPMQPASGKCPDDETPWTGRESAVQDRGDRIYAVRREGTSVVFEVRDRESRVLTLHQLGGNIMGTPALGRGSQADADVWVFAVDAVTNDLIHKRARADATGWDTEWGVVEGELTSDITATSHQSWGIEVFVRGGLRANGQKTIDHATYVFATGTWAQWYYTEGSVTSAPEVIDHPDGRMTVTACSDDRTYVHYRRAADGKWTGWRP